MRNDYREETAGELLLDIVRAEWIVDGVFEIGFEGAGELLVH